MPFGGLLSLGAGLGSSLFSGITGANAAGNAADAQAAAEQKVLGLEQSQVPAANSLVAGGVNGANSTLADYYSKNMGLLGPYLGTGTNALSQLNGMVNGGGFQAPTGVTQSNDPGYQFRMQQGEQALERSGAAAGGDISGGELKAAQQYGQNFGSNEYQNVYNRALGTYQTNFGNLQGLAGLGLSATNTGVGAGTSAGSQSASTTMSGGVAQAQNLLAGLGISADALTGQANARASGYVGQANAIGGAANNFSNGYQNLSLLNKLLGGGSGYGSTSPALNSLNSGPIPSPYQ